MKINFQSTSINQLLWAFSILTGLVWSYSIACHFLNFYLEPWSVRSLELLSVAAIASLHARKLARVTLPHLKSQDYSTLTRNALLLIGLVYVLTPALLPIFPTERKLEITALGEKNKASSGSFVEITSLLNDSSPIQNFMLKGKWEQQGNTIQTSGTQPASLSYNQIFRSRPAIQITFRTSPNSGKVAVTWDGVSQRLDLYSAKNGRNTIDLEPFFPWDKLGLIRQSVLVATVVTDFLSLAILILAGETWLVYLLSRIKPIQSLAKAGPVILILCLLAGLGWNILNLNKSSAGLAIFRDAMVSNRLDELLAHSQNYKQSQVYAILAEVFAGRSLIVPGGLLDKYELDAFQIKVTGRISAIHQASYPEELTDTEAQELLKIEHRDLVISPAQTRYTFVTKPSAPNGLLCMKTYHGSVYFGPANLIPGCQDLP